MQPLTGRIWRLTDTSFVCPPVHILNLPDSLCQTDPSVALLADVPGGTFTIGGMAASVFDPSQWPVGTWPVIYTFTGANGCIRLDTQFVVVKNCGIGVSEPGNPLDFTISPNPNGGDFEIRLARFSEAGPVTISLFDAAGKLLKSEMTAASQKMQFSAGSLQPGIHFLEIKNRHGKAVGSFLVE